MEVRGVYTISKRDPLSSNVEWLSKGVKDGEEVKTFRYEKKE